MQNSALNKSRGCEGGVGGVFKKLSGLEDELTDSSSVNVKRLLAGKSKDLHTLMGV